VNQPALALARELPSIIPRKLEYGLARPASDHLPLASRDGRPAHLTIPSLVFKGFEALFNLLTENPLGFIVSLIEAIFMFAQAIPGRRRAAALGTAN